MNTAYLKNESTLITRGTMAVLWGVVMGMIAGLGIGAALLAYGGLSCAAAGEWGRAGMMFLGAGAAGVGAVGGCWWRGDLVGDWR